MSWDRDSHVHYEPDPEYDGEYGEDLEQLEYYDEEYENN